MRTLLKCLIALGGVVFLAAILVPALCRRGGIYFGSYECARQWAAELKACDSLDDVKERFNCIRIEPLGDGAYQTVKVSDTGKERPSAQVHAFADGNWMACAYANSHGDKAGGTLVARDSEGAIRVFFGHIPGRPGFAHGETLGEVYTQLACNLTEMSLEEERPLDANDLPTSVSGTQSQ